MIYIVDHQDSFTWNVVHQFSEFDKVYCSNYFDINKKNNLIFVITFNNSLRIGQSYFYFKGQCIQELLFYE